MFPITINIVDQNQFKVPILMEKPKDLNFFDKVILFKNSI